MNARRQQQSDDRIVMDGVSYRSEKELCDVIVKEIMANAHKMPIFQQKQWQRNYWQQNLSFGNTWQKYFSRVWWRYMLLTYRQNFSMWYRLNFVRPKLYCPECYIQRKPGSKEPKLCVRLIWYVFDAPFANFWNVCSYLRYDASRWCTPAYCLSLNRCFPWLFMKWIIRVVQRVSFLHDLFFSKMLIFSRIFLRLI